MRLGARSQIGLYTIVEHLTDGTYGKIYKATHPMIDHPVVIKVLLPELTHDIKAIQRFESEADLIGRLNQHPNVVPIYDYWRDESGAYLVLKWLEGGSLKDVLEKQGALSLEDTLFIGYHIADVLAVAHQIGVIHRDIKPGNVLFDCNGEVYLADFGIAKQRDKHITARGAVLGTPAYLAPEQLLSGTATEQSDIYALGLLIYEMLTGKRPFIAKRAFDVMVKQVHEPLPTVHFDDPGLKAHINGILQRATAKDPLKRYAHVRDLAEDFSVAIACRDMV